MERKDRNVIIDILRCILSLFIVAIHTLRQETGAQYLIIIARSAVPMFFILSGYFISGLSNDNIKKRIKKSVKLLIISNLMFAIWAIISNYHNLRYEFISQTFNIKNIFEFILLNNSIYRGHLWFIGALLYCQILYYLEKKLLKDMNYKIRIMLIILLLTLLVIFSEVLNIDNIQIYRNFLFLGVPYYYIGILVKEKNISCKLAWLIPIIIVFNIMEVVVLRHIGKDYLLEHYIFTIPLSIVTIISAISCKHEIKDNIFSKIGKECSLYIYLNHVIVIDIIQKFEKISNILINQYALWILTFFISIAIAAIIMNIIKWAKVMKSNIISEGES